MNQVELIGNITRDIELKETSNGVKYTRFSIAVNRTTKKEDGTYDTDFFNIVAWRKTAELVKNYFGKGKKIAVVGKLQNYEYQGQDGIKRVGTEIQANEVFMIEKKEAINEPQQENNELDNKAFEEFGEKIEIEDDEPAF